MHIILHVSPPFYMWFTTVDITVPSPEVKELTQAPSLFGGEPQKAKHRKELKSCILLDRLHLQALPYLATLR